MSVAEVHRTVLQIVNEVQRKLGVNETAALTTTKQATLLLDFLNDVLDEVSDFGDWRQMYREVKVTAISSTHTYEIAVSGNVKNIYEVSWGDDISPMRVETIEDMRQLLRLSSPFGPPRQYALVDVSGANPIMRVHPIPVTADISAESSAGGVFNVAFYKKPRIMVTADSTAGAVIPFPSRMLVAGVLAKALLDENGGEPTPNYQAVYAEYQRMRAEALNRFNADTGSEATYFVPTGRMYG